jgi:urea transport system ATP-binding protein
MGRNGVGKTTLLKTLMGLVRPKSGSIEFENRDITGSTVETRARAGIGYVPQGREIFGQLTVEENLRIGLHARRDKVRDIPERIFELFPVLKQMLHRRGGDLSGGQQQQLAIGRALAIDPKILVLDEPTEGIQPNVVQQIGDVIVRLNEESNITVLLVEQKLHFARRVGKEFVILDRGRNVAAGTMGDLDEALVKKYLTV